MIGMFFENSVHRFQCEDIKNMNGAWDDWSEKSFGENNFEFFLDVVFEFKLWTGFD